VNLSVQAWPWTLASVCVLLFLGARAWAGGIPADDVLKYSGALEDADGKPLTGKRFVEVKFWRGSAADGDAPECRTESTEVTLEAGHFSVQLPAACKQAISQHADVKIEVMVNGASFGREALHAVPYAVEADHATRADHADRATGALETSLSSADKRVTDLEAATTPAAVVDHFNEAVNNGATVQLARVNWATAFDIGWALQHAAAAGACAAASPVGDSGSHHVVLPKPGGVTCTNACMLNSAGFTNCRTAIAIGSVMRTQATAYTDNVALNYNYSCEDSQSAYDEVAGQGLTSSYTTYCCCYL
jgi:hypothetical protein